MMGLISKQSTCNIPATMVAPAITLTTTITPLRASSATVRRSSSSSSTSKMDYLKVPESPRRSISRRRPLSASDVDRLLKQPLYPDIHTSLSESSLPSLTSSRNCKCTCRSRDDQDVAIRSGLQGQQMTSFFRLWSRKVDSQKLLQRSQLDLPSSMKRNSVHRECGCLTRNFINHSNKLHRHSHQPHCGCSSV
ncbi:hypothetical protein KP79_PYT14612 [Mizuhopecten yessoensis]|uniref:Uncharacterized protein n=1 Tax=Mizuhopecten yessoensis TaxID=6573 RepID=A0A210QJB2_MIZYE|nr:hypothetical protein KP79_PYT14612 [Mizuhopecten yessoensis]